MVYFDDAHRRVHLPDDRRVVIILFVGTLDVTRPPITITDVMADQARFGTYRAEVSERQRILDAIAQERLARAIAQALDPEEPEPFDPWD